MTDENQVAVAQPAFRQGVGYEDENWYFSSYWPIYEEAANAAHCVMVNIMTKERVLVPHTDFSAPIDDVIAKYLKHLDSAQNLAVSKIRRDKDYRRFGGSAFAASDETIYNEAMRPVENLLILLGELARQKRDGNLRYRPVKENQVGKAAHRAA